MEKLINDYLLNELSNFASENNFELYVVGGCVRDKVINPNCDITDYDLCSNMPLDLLIKFATINNISFKIINKNLEVIKFSYNDKSYEHARLRSEKYAINSSHNPCEVTFVNTIEEDYKRRDFTINALYYNVKSGEITDLVGGMSDITNRQIRQIVVGNYYSLSVDPVRLLRMIRFSLSLKFNIEKSTLNLALLNKNTIFKLSSDRIKTELNKIRPYKSDDRLNLLNIFELNNLL